MKVIYFVINDISMPGGLARVTLNLYKQLATKHSNKYSIKIITGTVSNADFFLDQSILNLDLPTLHNQTKFNKFLWYFSFIFKLNKFLKNNNPDIVIGIGTMINLCLSSFQFKNNYKLFATEHGAYEQRKGIVCSIRKLLYKRVNLVISLTEIDRKKFKKHHPHVIAIPNFTSFYKNTQWSLLNAKKILCVGRFTKQKGIFELVSFITPFLKKNIDWQLILIGEGPLESEIREKILSSNLEKNILIRKPVLQIEKEYLASSIYIMPSKTEGFPMVLLEAKSFGLPIVSFDCPTGPSEIIKNEEDGFLIPMGDEILFIERLQLLVDDSSLRSDMGNKALLNINEFYPDKIIDKWVKILDE